LKRITGLDLKRKLKDLNKDELEKLVQAIEVIEGKFVPGKETTTPAKKKKVSSIKRNKKGTIISYQIEGLGWIPKDRAIQLAREGRIDAVVAHSRTGSVYLRARPDSTIVNNLDHLG
jgi:hypothetical protein